MKKIISFVLILVMLLAITGCATPETTTQSPSPQQTTKPAEQTTKPAEQTTEPAKPKTVAFVMIGLNNDFFQALKGAYEKGFRKPPAGLRNSRAVSLTSDPDYGGGKLHCRRC